MNWFIVESTTDGVPKTRYTINAKYMRNDGELVVFYADTISPFPSRILKLEPGQIVFEASGEQAAMIDRSLAQSVSQEKVNESVDKRNRTGIQ